MRPLPRRSTLTGLEVEPLDDVARADALVARRIDELGLPTWPVDPDDVHMAVHEDARRAARRLRDEPDGARSVSRVSVRGARSLVDVLLPERPDARLTRGIGGFEVNAPARTVRMFAVETVSASSPAPSSGRLPVA